jgi:hypothetical protein
VACVSLEDYNILSIFIFYLYYSKKKYEKQPFPLFAKKICYGRGVANFGRWRKQRRGVTEVTPLCFYDLLLSALEIIS